MRTQQEIDMTALIPKELNLADAEFRYENDDSIALELAVQFGPYKDKSTKSTLTFRTSNISGYPMTIMAETDKFGEWRGPIEVGAISIQFQGSYERDILIAALQRIGLMTIPVYGKMERGPFEPFEEPEDALRQQTPPV
jgi:hypothetical protein